MTIRLMFEFLRALLESANARIKNPLVGSYILTWSFWNWKFWLVLFSSKDVDAKLKHLEALVASSFPCWAWSTLMPLCISVFLIWIMPRAALLILKITKDPTEKAITEGSSLRIAKADAMKEASIAELDELHEKILERSKRSKQIHEDITAASAELSGVQGQIELARKRLETAKEEAEKGESDAFESLLKENLGITLEEAQAAVKAKKKPAGEQKSQMRLISSRIDEVNQWLSTHEEVPTVSDKEIGKLALMLNANEIVALLRERARERQLQQNDSVASAQVAPPNHEDLPEEEREKGSNMLQHKLIDRALKDWDKSEKREAHGLSVDDLSEPNVSWKLALSWFDEPHGLSEVKDPGGLSEVKDPGGLSETKDPGGIGKLKEIAKDPTGFKKK